MLKNNGKTNVGKYFFISIIVICFMFTALGFNLEESYAVDFNETGDDIALDISAGDKLENSQIENDMLNTNLDEDEVVGATHTLNGGSFKDIRQAIKDADSGDTIKLSGTFTASSDLEKIRVDKKLTITSSSQAILDGKNFSAIFFLTQDAKGTVISNLKFINGIGERGGAIWTWANQTTIDNCVFENNYALGGGAISSRYTADDAVGVIVKNCYFKNNSAKRAGGAVTLYGNKSQVINCVFDSNYATNNEALSVFGGAIQMSLDEVKTVAVVADSIFINNWVKSNSAVPSHGGAGCIRDGVSYKRCTFIGNRADEGGALTYHASGTVSECIFINNTASEFGGAISTGFQQISMNLRIWDCVFENNSAPLGGAAQLLGENINFHNCNFTDNFASQNGGAINAEATTVNLTSNRFIRNVVGVDGGAIFINGKNTIIKDSLFQSNEAIPDASKLNDGLGGAIYVNSTSATISNNEFKYNTARNGSAVYYDKYGVNLKITNNVMHENQAWVYALPISAKDIYFGDSENISVVIYGGNNIARYGNLAVSNAIYNAAVNEYISVEGYTPIDGATNTGELYQDDREYQIDILLTVMHEDSTVVYNNTLKSSYLGEINTVLTNLKPGKYYVTAKHYEDTYYKEITNRTSFTVNPKIDNQITITSDKTVYNYEEIVVWTVNMTNNGPNDATGVIVSELIPKGLIYYSDTSNGLYNPKTEILNVSTLDVGEKLSFEIKTIINTTGDVLNRVNITARETDSDLSNNFDERLITVNPAVDIMVIKTVNNTYPDYHDLVNWTIVVRNNGPDTAHNITLRDIVPDSLIIVFASKNYNISNGTWKIPSLAAKGEVTFNIITFVNQTGLTQNSAYAEAVEFDYDLSNNQDSDLIKVKKSADLSIIKLVNVTYANYGDMIKWTLIIKNAGPDNATGVKICDLLPEGFIYVNSTLKFADDVVEIGDLAVGGQKSIDIITRAETTGNLTNYANVTGNEYDYNLTNNEDTQNITVYPSTDLEITKTVDEKEPGFADIVEWTITVINNGPDIAHNVKVFESLPDSLIWIEDDSEGDYNPQTGIWNIENLAIGEVATLTISCQVNRTGIIENNATVSGLEHDWNLSNNYDNETIEVEPAADVSIIKMVNNTTPNYKDLIKWTLIIKNDGPDKASEIEVDEELPDGLVFINATATKGIYINDKWVMCCLENGEVQRMDIICLVNKTGISINNVSITSEVYDPNTTNNEDNESIEVPPSVDIEVIEKVSNLTPLFGDNVTWEIIIKNNGPDNATQVKLTDILPDSLIIVGYNSTKGSYENGIWNVGTLNVGDVESINITTSVNALGKIVNTAKATSFEYDWNMSNNQDDAEIKVLPVADLSVEKTVNNDNPNYEDSVVWTLKIKNNGPNDATNVVVEDYLPKELQFVKSSDDKNFKNGKWNVGVLKAGEVKKLTITTKIIATGFITNSVCIWSDENDPNPDNNYDDVPISVAFASDLAITKIASKHKYVVGDMIEYKIVVVNNGPDTAYNVKVDEILDDLLKLKSFEVTKGKFNKFSLIWTIDKLKNGESAILYIKAVALGSGIVKNTVSVTSDSFDYDMSNNKDSAIVKVANKISKNSKSNLNPHKLDTLEKHKTANPLAILALSCLFSLLFLGENISKKR